MVRPPCSSALGLGDVASWEPDLDLLDAVDAVDGADAVIVLTEWTSFRGLDWHAIAAQMGRPAWLCDARDITDAEAARKA